MRGFTFHCVVTFYLACLAVQATVSPIDEEINEAVRKLSPDERAKAMSLAIGLLQPAKTGHLAQLVSEDFVVSVIDYLERSIKEAKGEPLWSSYYSAGQIGKQHFMAAYEREIGQLSRQMESAMGEAVRKFMSTSDASVSQTTIDWVNYYTAVKAAYSETVAEQAYEAFKSIAPYLR